MNEGPYSNIVNALNSNTGFNSGNSMEDLTRKSENFKLVDKLNQEGVSLKDLIGQIDDLKKKIDGLEKQQPRTDVDAGVFMAMEAAVKDDPEVIQAKEHLAEIGRKIRLEIYMKDPRYSEAYDSYRSKVSERYVQVHSGEQSKARKKTKTTISTEVDIPIMDTE